MALPPPACSTVHLKAVSFRFAGHFRMDYLLTHRHSDLKFKVLNHKTCEHTCHKPVYMQRTCDG